MIFKDTRLKLISHVAAPTSEQFIVFLSRHNISCESSERINDTQPPQAPVIWIIFLKDLHEFEEQNRKNFHANHSEIIYLIENCDITNGQLSPLNQLPDQPGPCVVLWKEQESRLIEQLYIAEQRILQRNLFVAEVCKEPPFLDLKLLGRSNQFADTLELIKKVADNDASVNIKGQTGTGKELTARAIHYLSPNRGGPFIPINCGAFTDDLFLSELFGYEKGAFTGATATKPGLLELADSGTVFLDEIDSLSSKAQVALLRYLQDQEIRRVGSTQIKRVKVRVICASNANLKILTEKNQFRADLLYRLDVLSIELPPLHTRGDDIQLLAQYFLAKMGDKQHGKQRVLDIDTIESIHDYHWPGNIRELENYIKRLYLMSTGYIISDTSLTADADTPSVETAYTPRYVHGFQEEKNKIIDRFERSYLNYVLNQTRGNVSKASDIAKKERRSFSRLMKKHCLVRDTYVAQ